jgi:hypothetical protein
MPKTGHSATSVFGSPTFGADLNQSRNKVETKAKPQPSKKMVNSSQDPVSALSRGHEAFSGLEEVRLAGFQN